MSVDEALARAVADARAAWPDLALDSASFLEQLRARLPAGDGAIQTLDALHVTDLFLAAACLARVRGAAEALDVLLAARSPLPDPEIAHLRETYNAEFQQAFHGALGELSGPDRLLLRQRYVDGISGASIARLRGVAPSTVTRALQTALDSLRLSARKRLADKLRLSPSQIDSLAALVVSRLEVSLPRALPGDGED